MKKLTKAERRDWWDSLTPHDQFLYGRYRAQYKKNDLDRPLWRVWREQALADETNARLDAEFAERVS